MFTHLKCAYELSFASQILSNVFLGFVGVLRI